MSTPSVRRISRSHQPFHLLRVLTAIPALFLCVVLVVLVVLGSPSRTEASPVQASGCHFALGFQELHDQIPEVVGDCLVNEHHDPVSGDALQETTGADGHGGLLVWRKKDNWTAFTDGYRTWVKGPNGVQSRLNSERFSWEQGDTAIEITQVPPYGSDEDLSGRTRYASPDEYAVLTYILVDGGWWTKPYWADPLTEIEADGSFGVDVTTGGKDAQATEIRVYLVPRGFEAPAMSGQAALPDSLAGFPMAVAVRSGAEAAVPASSAP